MEVTASKILGIKIILSVYYGSGSGFGILIASRDWRLALFTTTITALNAFLIIICHPSYLKSLTEETLTNVLSIKTTEGLDETVFSFLSDQIHSHHLWVKFSIIITFALFLRVTISKRVLPIAFCSDYLLIEFYYYICWIYVRLFHSESVIVDFLLWRELNCFQNWSNSKIIAASLCFDAIKGSTICCIFYITISVIPAGAYREIRAYYDDIKFSEKKKSTLKFRIVNRIKPIMEKYPAYLIILWCNVVLFFQSLV